MIRVIGPALFLAAAGMGLTATPSFAETGGENAGEEPRIGGLTASTILKALGARMEHGTTPRQMTGYSQHFKRTDLDGDGKHSKAEYIENGKYLTPGARRGIFNAADADQDGFVTEAEYTLNRIITDEAKEILQSMDDDENGTVQRTEFLVHANARLFDAELTVAVFRALDTNNDGELAVPEYLRVWGQWARAGGESPEVRLANAKKPTEK